MDERQSEDAAIHFAVRRGDANAWRQWYQLYFDELYTFVLWRCNGSRHEAEEVVQDAWLVAVRQIDSFDPSRGPFIAWIKGIAHNLLGAKIRKHRDRPKTIPLVVNGGAGSFDAEQHRHSEMKETEFDSLEVAEVFERLPEHYRGVLRAKYLDQLSVVQIAERTDQSNKSVESLLSRARNAFRRQFEKLRSNNER